MFPAIFAIFRGLSLRTRNSPAAVALSSVAFLATEGSQSRWANPVVRSRRGREKEAERRFGSSCSCIHLATWPIQAAFDTNFNIIFRVPLFPGGRCHRRQPNTHNFSLAHCWPKLTRALPKKNIKTQKNPGWPSCSTRSLASSSSFDKKKPSNFYFALRRPFSPLRPSLCGVVPPVRIAIIIPLFGLALLSVRRPSSSGSSSPLALSSRGFTKERGLLLLLSAARALPFLAFSLTEYGDYHANSPLSPVGPREPSNRDEIEIFLISYPASARPTFTIHLLFPLRLSAASVRLGPLNVAGRERERERTEGAPALATLIFYFGNNRQI